MPNALISSVTLLDDIDGSFPMRGIYLDWLANPYFMLLWADHIYCPKTYIEKHPKFDYTHDINPAVADIMNESMSNAWDIFVKAKIIQKVPISKTSSEAARSLQSLVKDRVGQTLVHGISVNGVPVQVNPSNNLEMVKIGNHGFCSNRVDSMISHLPVAAETKSIVISDSRDDLVLKWMFPNGISSGMRSSHDGKNVLSCVGEIDIPKKELIPNFACECDECKKKGDTDKFYTPAVVKHYIGMSRDRVNEAIDNRDLPEVASFRKMIGNIQDEIKNVTSSENSLAEAQKELDNSIKKSEVAIKKKLNDVNEFKKKVIYATPALSLLDVAFGVPAFSTTGSSMAAIAEGYQSYLTSKHGWIKLMGKNQK